MDLRRIILARYAVFLAVVLMFSLAIAGRIVYIQFTTGDKWDGQLQSLENKTEIIRGNRGNVCSANGRIMASSVPFYEIRFDLAAPGVKEVFNKEVDNLAHELSKVFTDRSRWEFKKQLQDAYKKSARYYLVHPRKVNYDELQRIKKFPIFNRGQYKGGFIVEQEYVRYTPHGSLAYRTIGIMNKGAFGGLHGSVGISGIEGKYEGYLRGKEGLAIRQNLSGRWVNVSSVEPETGKDVITTIDIYLQDVVESALRNQLVKSNAEYGTAILMEVKTGKIRAIVNLGLQSGNYNEIYNYAIGHEGCTEPGSTFKLLSLMVALDESKVDTSDVFDTEDGKWKIYDKTIYDSDYGHGQHGKMTVREIFERSSNVGFAKMIDKHYRGREKDFIDRLYSMGLNKPLDMGFRGEASPYVKYPTDKNWWGTSLAYISHGYEIQVSPMQMLSYYNAVANNGKLMKPMFVEAIRSNGELVKKFKPEVLKSSICSKETLGKVQALLEGVVENGTARNLRSKQYKFAGKTGTAKALDIKSGYSHNKYRASFAGYFPVDHPKYSCIVVISEPKGSFYGGSVAGPVFREIADCVFTSDFTLNLTENQNNQDNHQVPNMFNGLVNETMLVCDELDIKYKAADKSADWFYTYIDNETINMKPRMLVENQMPNVLGMGAADAIFLIEKAGLKVKLKGVGKVRKQSPEPGSLCRNGQLIYIDLS